MKINIKNRFIKIRLTYFNRVIFPISHPYNAYNRLEFILPRFRCLVIFKLNHRRIIL
jgi:hypothetical protein